MRIARMSLSSGIHRVKHGYTAFEALIVIGLIAVTAGLTVPLYRTYQIRSDLNLATEGIVQELHRAQALARAGQDDSAWGVYVQEGTLFSGEGYILRDVTKDEVISIPETIDTSGLPEVIFSRLDGIPNQTGSIYLTALNGEYREIIVDNFGLRFVGEIQSTDIPEGSIGGASSSEEEEEESSSTSSVTSSAQSSSVASTSSSTSAGSSSTPTSSSSAGQSSTSSSVGPDDDANCSVNFDLDDGEVNTVGTNDITLKVLGSEITYGQNGPKVAVRVSASVTAGTTWVDLYDGEPIVQNDSQQLTNIPDSTPLVLKFNGRYSWVFNKTYQSDDRQGHVYVLKNGDKVPNYAPFGNQASLSTYLKNIIDNNNRIKIGPRDLVYLVELGGLDSGADFQDAVILATFNKKTTTCNSSNEPRVKISFNRLENTGNGNVANKVYVGPNAIAFSEEQWIPLVANGQTIIDNGMQENVAGFAFERGNGWIKIRNHGSHSNDNHKELVDARVLFNKAYITSTVNDTGGDASENPTDGITNDGPNGDEFEAGPNTKSMTFKTRTTTNDDGVILYWNGGEPSASSSSAQSSSSSSSTSSTSSQSSSQSSQSSSVDACAIPFTVSSDGLLTTQGKSDMTIFVLGSESTYGFRGPKIQVRGRYSLDNGATWQTLLGYRGFKGNEIVTLRDVPANSRIVFEFNGRYSWLFNRTVRSGIGDNRVKVLTKGQSAPDTETLRERTSLTGFMTDILDPTNRMNIGTREVAVLVELNDVDTTSDYQDAVLLLSVDKPASLGGCPRPTSSSSSSVSSASSSTSSGGSSSSTSTSSSSSSKPKDTDGDGVSDADDICSGTFLPESVPTEYMLFNSYALTSRDNIFRTGPRKEISEFTLLDTGGCSCGQILDAIDGKGKHRFNEYPTLYRNMKSLFSYYIKTSRKFGCGKALLDMVSEGL